jgi:hypothetical protein
MIGRKRGRSAATSNQNNSLRVAVIDFNGPNASILVQGRGSLCCTRGSVDIHGYRLTANSKNTSPYSIQEMIRENNISIHSLTFLPFDVPAWSTSWLTITSTSRNPGAQVIIRSAAATTPAAAAPQQPKASIVKTTAKEQATFSIHDAISRENIDSADDDDDARPTVIPDEWKQSASDILDDYHLHQHQEQPQQQQHDSSCTAASLPSSSLSESPQVQNPPLPRRFVVAITGGKGVGKSTYLRYLLHRFMSSQPRGHDDSSAVGADDDESQAEAQETLPPLNNKDRFIAILDG